LVDQASDAFRTLDVLEAGRVTDRLLTRIRRHPEVKLKLGPDVGQQALVAVEPP